MAHRPTNGRSQKLGPPRGITVGYGYRPEFALYWSLGIILASWLTFSTARNFGYMTPREAAVITYMAKQPGASLPPRTTEFNAFIYALDVYLPVIELGQDSTWKPSDHPALYALPPRNDGTIIYGLSEMAVWSFRSGFHRFVYWTRQILGWLFVSLYIAGMSGIMKKE